MRVLLWLLLLTFIYLFYSHAKYSNTGIDITDEAFHYFLLQSSKPGLPFIVYGNLFGPIINLLDLEIAEIRMLSLTTHLLCGLLLAIAVKPKISKTNNYGLQYILFSLHSPLDFIRYSGSFLFLIILLLFA